MTREGENENGGPDGSSALLACPYCGETVDSEGETHGFMMDCEPFFFRVENETFGQVRCCNCGAKGPRVWGRGEKEAFQRAEKAWNRRAS